MTRLQGNDSNRLYLVLGTLVAVALIALALFAVRSGQTSGNKSFNFNTTGLPFAGKADAPVTLLSVEDFKCPACKSFEDSVAGELRTKYVDTGKVKWYTLIWPFISTQVARNPEDDSKYAAQAARCVFEQGGNDAFNAYKSILFRAQESETIVWATKARLKDLASNVTGVDAAKFATCLDTDATAAKVEADKKQAEDNGVNSTPTIFVNGKKVDATLDAISSAVDAALKQ